MTIGELARRVMEDPAYAVSIVARAQAGTLPVEIEMFLLEEFQLAGGPRLPTSVGSAGCVPAQGPTFALVRPPAFSTEEKTNE